MRSASHHTIRYPLLPIRQSRRSGDELFELVERAIPAAFVTRARFLVEQVLVDQRQQASAFVRLP